MSADRIAAHLAHLRAGGRSEHTIEDREKVLRRLERDLPRGLDKAAVRELEAWLGHPAWSRQTRATYHLHLSGYYRWCHANGHLPRDPSITLIKPRVPHGVPRPATDAQLQRALTHGVHPYRTSVLLAAYATCRAAEVAGLDRDDIDRDAIRILGKGGKERIVPTHPLVWEAVEPLPSGPLVIWCRHRVDGDWVSRHVSAWLTAIGLPEVTLHRFRHWCATNLLNHGADLRTVQELMGHSSPTTTAIYTQITDRQRRTAVLTLPAHASNPRQEAA